MNTKRALTVRSLPPSLVLATVTFQVPSTLRFRSRTWVLTDRWKLSRRASAFIIWRVISPKLTSVPIGIRVAATGSLVSRPVMTSGIHSEIFWGSSEYSIPA